MTIEQRIFALMDRYNISISRLSKNTGISQIKIKGWKSNSSVTIQELSLVSHSLNVTMEFLVSGKDACFKLKPELISKLEIINEKARVTPHRAGCFKKW